MSPLADRLPPPLSRLDPVPPGSAEERSVSAANLPRPLTSFIGRERQVAAVLDLLRREDVQLVTLTGPGGVGKTRLAIRVAEAVADEFPDGVWFVPLAPVRDPALVPATIALALGVQETSERPIAERLVTHLSGQRGLLVLDNFEHVLDSGPLLTSVLAACPALTVMVTSRTVLRLSGEHDFEVPPLASLDPNQVPALDRVRAAEAVRLFVERAAATHSAFALTDANAADVATLCAQLDGLPLAIELAAARVRSLPPRALLSRFDQRLRLLTGGPRDQPVRLRSLRDAIDWSYDLLSAQEQNLFRRLAVFTGGFTLDAAAAVSPSEEALGFGVLDGIARLINKSLVQDVDERDGEPRYRMLETVREYGLDRLEASGEFESVRRLHAEHYMAFAETVAAPLYADPEQALARIDAELDNLRAALAWADERGDATRLLTLAARLKAYWHLSGRLSEGRTWLERAIADSGDAPANVRAIAWREAGFLNRYLGNHQRAEALGRMSETFFRERGDAVELAQALVLLGHVAEDRGQLSRSLALHEEALQLLLPIDQRFWTAITMRHVGWLSFLSGDISAAERHLEEALARFRQEGNPFGAAMASSALGELAFARGDNVQAAALKQERLNQTWDVWSLHECLAKLGKIAAAGGQHQRAARLLGAAEANRERLGIGLAVAMVPQHERAAAAVRSALGNTTFAETWAQGRALSSEQARAEAAQFVRDVTSSRTTAPHPANCYGLTQREREILKLVATGHSNREIADTLYISVPTVKRHLSTVYAKLGLPSRSAATAFAHTHDLV